MKVFVIVMAWLVAALIFWLAFFGVAPAIAALIPASDWRGILVAIVYGFIAWFGGLALPLTIGIGGTIFAVTMNQSQATFKRIRR